MLKRGVMNDELATEAPAATKYTSIRGLIDFILMKRVSPLYVSVDVERAGYNIQDAVTLAIEMDSSLRSKSQCKIEKVAFTRS